MASSLLTWEERVLERISSKTATIVSIVIPALNEENGIAGTIKAVPVKELKDMGYEVQVLVVDNGSTDRTTDLAKQAGADVVFEARRGYGRAYKTGFAYAKGDIVATADADMTYPVEDIPKMVQQLEEENLDFITTNRYAYMRDGAMSMLHKIGNGVLNTTTRLLFQADLRDSQSGMWVFRKAILDRIVLQADSMAFSQELKIEACYYAGCRWKEIPIEYRARVGEVKLRSWQDGFGNLFQLINKRISRPRVNGNGHHHHPLKIADDELTYTESEVSIDQHKN